MHSRNYLLLAGALVGSLIVSDAARAQAGGPLTNEKWLCTDKVRADEGKPPLEFVLQNGVLIAQPLGAPRYHVLDNTPYGLIAADYSADMDIGFVTVYVATVLIDRMSGAFVSSVSSSGSASQMSTGHCKLVSSKEATVAVSR